MKVDKFLVIIIFSIIALSSLAYWQFKNFHKNFSEIEMPKFELPLLPEQSNNQELTIEEYSTPDGKLKMGYGSDWQIIGSETLNKIFQGTVASGTEILFLAEKINIQNGSFSFLSVQNLVLKENEGLTEVIDKLKTEFAGREGQMESIELKNEENFADFTAKSKSNDSVFFSKGKIVLIENSAYIVSFATLEKDWLEFENEAEEILKTIEFNF